MSRIPDIAYHAMVGVLLALPALATVVLGWYALSGEADEFLRLLGFVGAIASMTIGAVLWMYYLDTTGRPGGFR